MDESALTARARAGDRGAFDALYARYERRIFVHLLRRLGADRAEDAADLAQLTFLKAFVALPGTDERLNINAWLHRIAGNLSVDWLRRSGRTRPFDPLAHDRGDEDRLVRPEAHLLDAETRGAVARALRRMRPRYREALLLHVRDDLPCAEVGARMGLSRPAVKSLLFRARAEFRTLYAAEDACDQEVAPGPLVA
jgi:RNA polymerase sigma-70 factor (ECF subfamily)